MTRQHHIGSIAVLPFVALLLLFVAGCGDTSVDPVTAQVQRGDLEDTIPTFELEKAALRVGLIGGSGGNAVVQDFVPVRSEVRYLVDTLDDGSPIRVRNIVLLSVLDDPDDPTDADDSNPFHPIRRILLRVPSVNIAPNLRGTRPLAGDPDASSVAGIVVDLAHLNARARLWVRGDDARTQGWGQVTIESIDLQERRISIAYAADLVRADDNPANARLPETVVLEGLVELPY